MKNLLVATDLSARSDRAVERAIALAREHDARLTVVHVVDEDMPRSLAELQERAAKEILQGNVDTFAAQIRSNISIEVVRGRPNSDIVEIAENSGAEMVVLGRHREDVLKDTFRGTTLESIIRASNVPVLLVKERESGPYGRIVVGVDFSVYSRRAIEFAVNFTPNGAFHLVHAYDVPFKGFLRGDNVRREVSEQHQARFQKMIDEEMSAFLSGLAAKAPTLEPVLQEGAVRDVLHQQIDRLKPDLLVIGTHGRTGVAKAFLGSVAEDLLNDPPCDVLAVKAW